MPICDICHNYTDESETVDRNDYTICHDCIDRAVIIAVFGTDPVQAADPGNPSLSEFIGNELQNDEIDDA